MNFPKFIVEPCQSSKVEESFYVHWNQQNHEKNNFFKSGGSVSESLSFKGIPKRKIAKCETKRERNFKEEKDHENLRKLRDSFGNAYQEYYLQSK